MKKQFVYWDTAAEPITTRWYLKPLMWILSAPVAAMHRLKITKTGMEGVKGPYVLLCNHNSFFDFQAVTKAIFPQNANYIVAIDAFVGFPGLKWLMQRVGCIGKRKFTNDVNLIRQSKKVIEKGNVLCIYPEARYSLVGTTAVLPESLGKMCRMMGVPVVTFMCHGNHINAPCWNQKDRGVKGLEAELKMLITAEELRQLSVDQINDRIVEAFQYDDYAWQKEKGVHCRFKGRAQGLHRVLYQCPHCGIEFEMNSKGDILSCAHCGKQWRMSELGELQALEGNTEFSHIPDWYEWERSNVRSEVESGSYDSGVLPVRVLTLPDNTPVWLGEGTLQHDMHGFHIKGKTADGEEFSEEHPVPSKYSCHVEFAYKQFGELLDLSTIKDTWFFSSADKRFCLTKFALATEELYRDYRMKEGKACRPGLA